MRPTNQRGSGMLAMLSMLAMAGQQINSEMAQAARDAGIRQEFGGRYVAYGNPIARRSHSQEVKSKRMKAHNERQRRKR